MPEANSEATSKSGPGWLRRNWMALALAVSVALNLGFGAGFALRAWRMGGPPPILEAVKMQPEQRKALSELRQGARQRMRDQAAATRERVHGIWQEMARPDPDLTKVGEIVDGLAADRARAQRQNLAAAARFMATLTPEQRETFARVAEQRMTEEMGRRMGMGGPGGGGPGGGGPGGGGPGQGPSPGSRGER